MRVFLSSTYEDLIQHRSLAAQAIERLGQDTRRMEVFGARPQQPTEACLREIDSCELFLGMYAHRYGFVPEGSELSITEMEYQHATNCGKPTFCYVINKSHPWPPSMMEGDPGRARLTRFKESIQKYVVRDTFTTPEDLAMKVASSLGLYLTERSATVYEELRAFVQQQSEQLRSAPGTSAAQRDAVVKALDAAVQIANRTFQYFADQRRTEQRDYDRETALAEGWRAVGIQLLNLEHPPTDLAERYLLKSQYWSSPDGWTDERIAASKIGLEEIANESRSLLLGQAGSAN
jgi:hypothetical protein